MSSTTQDFSHERRAALRTTFETDATVHMVNQQFNCLTRDLSPRGVALAGHERSVPPGTFMRIQFKLPNERLPVGIDGILVRSDPQDSGTVWGLEFIAPEAHEQVRIEEYLDTQRPPVLSARQFLTQIVSGVSPEPHRDSVETNPPPAPSEHPELPRIQVIPVGPQYELPELRSQPVHDEQFIRVYEQAMFKASLERQVPETASHQQRRVEPPPSHGDPVRLEAGDRKPTLDVELQWLYEQAKEES